MKKEATGKKKLGLIIAIIAAVVALAVGGTILAITMLGQDETPSVQPTEPGGEGTDVAKPTSKLYWNVDRDQYIDMETGLSTRPAAEDGLYHIRFAVDGQQVELPCADKKLVTRIDMRDIVGLAFDADGVIVDVYDVGDVATLIQDRTFVKNFDGKKLETNSSQTLNGMDMSLELSEDVKIYIVEDPRPEVPGRDFTVGAEDTLKMMDTIVVYGSDENTPHTIFVIDRLYESDVYWRASTAMYDSTNKVSTRPLGKDDYWYIDMMKDGEIVTVRTKDQACINALDGYAIVSCGCGLVFDKNGDVVDVFNAGLAVKGRVAANNYDVTAIDGTTVTLTRRLNGTELGRTYTMNIVEKFPIYNVTTTADKFGELTDLQMGDRVYLLADSSGKPVQAYVTCRLVDSPMYYNVSPSYNSTTLETNRKPDADGWYTISLAVNGKLKDYRTKNKALMTQIDAYGNRVFGLKVSGDVIKKVYNPECVTGAYSYAANNWVTSIAGTIVGTVNASGAPVNGIMADDCKVYDISGCSAHLGAKTTLQEGDRIMAYVDPDSVMRYIYVTSRKVDGVSLYWNFEKKYDAAKQQTTRTPDADGYYVFKMAKCGSAGEKLMKTKDIELASKIDKNGVYALCLKTKGDIIQKVYPATAINAGYSRIFGIYATQQNDDTHYGAMFYTTGATANIDISLAKIYNVSGVYKKGAGEKTTLQPNDRLMLLYGQSGKAEHILVYERECGSSAYFQFNPNYNAQARTTLPDADGYYNYTVTSQGKIKNVKTKDKDIAAYMDGRFLAFGLKLKGDIIVGAYSAVSTKEIATSGVSFYDVTKIKGNKITLERTVPGSSNTGDVKEIDISKAKVYNVSAYAGDAWGKTAKLGIGDRVQTYINEKNETTLVYIVWENTREAGHKSYCEHCKQEVFWHPYYGTIDFIDKHYYLPADYSQYYSKGWGIQGRTSGWDWVLDLNGHTYAATGSYAFAVRGNSTLTVVDTSKAQTGRITGIGVQIKDAEGNVSKYQSSQAGIFQVLDGGVLNLRGGTYTRSVNREITNLRRAGVAVVNKDGTLNIYDGAKLVNNDMDVPLDLTTSEPHTEIRRAPQGGALYNNGGTINIYGGVIANNGKIHADFKEFEGTAVGNGGNIFQSSGELNIYGGKITGGWSRGNGGNIYVNGGKLNIAGGEISGATSVNGANNIIVAADKNVEINITGGKVTGDFTISAGNTLKISGKPVISMGEKQALFLGEGVKAKVGTMKDGAKIVLSSTGIFTTDFATKEAAEAILAKKYFVGESSLTPFYVEGKALACGKQACLNGHTTKEQCTAANCDKELLKWNPWTDTESLPASGNYYLTKNVTVDAKTTVSGKLVLDLNGFNVTRNVTEQQITDGVGTTAFEAPANATLIIADLSGKAVPGTVKSVLPKDGDGNVIAATGTQGIITVSTGSTVEIYNGIFDGKDMKTSNTATGGIFCGGGALTIHGGTFYGWSNTTGAANGNGTVFGGWSTSVLTINNGTFYGGATKQGGMFSTTGKIVINGGLFDGNNSATNTAVDASKPRTVATHGGLIHLAAHNNAALTITGGTFKAGQGANSGGMIYVEANNKIVVDITGGTFQASSKAQNGGFIRFRGKDLNISGVTLEGFAVSNAANADIISFEGSGKLTVGKDAVIAGGVMVKSGTGVVMTDNAKINAGTNCGLKMSAGTLDISALNNEGKLAINYADTTKAFYEAADEATAKALVDNKVVVSADPNYKVIADGKNLTVKVQIQWNEWNAAAAATMYGGAEADNLHLTKLPTAGDYKLIADVTVDARVAMTGNVNLNLNGFTITRVIKSGAADFGVYTTNAKGNLYITDEIKDIDPSKSVGTVKTVFDTGVTTCAGTGFLGYVGAGYSITIDEGIFDFRGVKTTASATTGAGAIIVDGTLTINGGTFYGANAGTTGYGTVIGGRSANVITINGGTFYGNNAKQGGIISTTGNLTINGGLFDGNTNASNGKVNSSLPQAAATHGGLFYVAKALTITGGEFKAGRVSGSGGVAYVTGSGSVISGGTFTAGGQTNYAGFFRFDGSATITGVTLTGGKATTNGNNIAFGSNSNATLTIGQDAVIDGGIMFRSDKTGNKLVLVGNAQVNGGTGAAYSLNLANATVHIGAASNAAVATVGSTFTNYIATYDAAGNVTGVQAK